MPKCFNALIKEESSGGVIVRGAELAWMEIFGTQYPVASHPKLSHLPGSDRMRLNPELPPAPIASTPFRAPPIGFIAWPAVQFAMMATAERHGEFVADLDPETSGLRKAQ